MQALRETIEGSLIPFDAQSREYQASWRKTGGSGLITVLETSRRSTRKRSHVVWWGKKKQKATLSIELASFKIEDRFKRCSTTKPSVFSEVVGEWDTMARRCGFTTWQGENLIQIMKMNDKGLPVVFLTVHGDCTWQVVVSRVPVPPESHLTRDVGDQLTSTDLEVLLERLSKLFVCEGNQDFSKLIELKRGGEGQVLVQISINDVCDGENIRHKKCLVLYTLFSQMMKYSFAG